MQEASEEEEKADLPEALCLVNGSQLEQAQLGSPRLGPDTTPLLLALCLGSCIQIFCKETDQRSEVMPDL